MSERFASQSATAGHPLAGDDVHAPTHRMLQIYAFDPSLDLDLETARINRSAIPVAWEEGLEPGPVGAYVEVIDIDPASQCTYDPVDLNHPHLLVQDGLPPSEGNPQFHQQMVYAVAMKTIGNFERALGRSVHWSPRLFDERGRLVREAEKAYVPRLRIYPHGLREANAYYSPDKKALLFGYFNAANADARAGLPGGMTFTCLSHDVIAHELTHAILDGIHRRMLEPSNPDVLAFHEAFADLVAIFQHFTLPGVLAQQIAATRGDLETENLLAKLAIQFGRVTGRGGSLRDALGGIDPATGRWRRPEPDPSEISRTHEPHARGAILVAAIFEAFLTIYKSHTADLRRIATGGTGRLPEGDIHPDLVARCAAEAEKVAQRVLSICIRALDYLPPVDVTFGDYVRALITADVDLVPDDPRRYRVAFIAAFRNRGIYPRDVRTLSIESLRWTRFRELFTQSEREEIRSLLPPVSVLRLMAYANDFADAGGFGGEFPAEDERRGGPTARRRDIREATAQLTEAYCRPDFDQSVSRDSHDVGGRDGDASRRKREYLRERQFAAYLHDYILAKSEDVPQDRQECVWKALGIDLFGENLRFEVHAVRPTTRVRPDGRTKTELLVLLTQRTPGRLDAGGSIGGDLEYRFRGGCTLLIDPDSGEVVYAIAKNIHSEGRRVRQESFLSERLAREGLDARARYFVRLGSEPKVPQEAFRLLHRGGGWED